MARKRPEANGEGRVREPKVSKTYRLSARKIAAAREALGAPTATAAIETALDMVIFRKELVDGTAAMLGVDIRDRFGGG
jgi:hypothetical protein